MWYHLTYCLVVFLTERIFKACTQFMRHIPTFVYLLCTLHANKSTTNLRLIDNLIVSPDTSTVHGDLCWLTWLKNHEASGLKQRLTDCVLSVIDQCPMSPHEFFTSYLKIMDRQQNSSAVSHFRLSETSTPLCGSQFDWRRAMRSSYILLTGAKDLNCIVCIRRSSSTWWRPNRHRHFPFSS
jgi:hypothetical protein